MQVGNWRYPADRAVAVLRRQLGIRPYQRNFADFCAHYDMAPSACRPYTPTDKDAAENAVGTLKKFLKGRSFARWEELQATVARHMQSASSWPNTKTSSSSGRPALGKAISGLRLPLKPACAATACSFPPCSTWPRA